MSYIENLNVALEQMFYFVLVYMLLCLGCYKFIFLWMRPTPSHRFDICRLINFVRLESFNWRTKVSMNRVLFVISHPDDESMFFGPVIHHIARNLDSRIYLLCLSHGNFKKQVGY